MKLTNIDKLRLDKLPPGNFPIHLYRPFPTVTDDRYILGIDTGSTNFSAVLCRVKSTYTDEKFYNYLEVEKFIYLRDEMTDMNMSLNEKFYLIMKTTWEVCTQYNVIGLACEMLCLNSTPEDKLSGVLIAHTITSYLRGLAFVLGIYFNEISITQIKKVVADKGNATKEEVQYAVSQLLKDSEFENLVLSNDHMADAFAIAYTYAKLYYKKASL